MRKFFRYITIAFFSIFYRVETIHPENIPSEGPAVLCANHISQLDMFSIGFRIRRWIYYMAKEELFRIPLLAAVLRKLGAFPVKRGRGDVDSIKSAFRLLEEGHIIGIFPEGTRKKKQNGGRARPKSGAALIAAKAGVPVIPVAIVGNYRLFSRIRIIYGKPMKLDKREDGKYSGEELGLLSEKIMDRIFALMEVPE